MIASPENPEQQVPESYCECGHPITHHFDTQDLSGAFSFCLNMQCSCVVDKNDQ